jgi:hypothetical protein
VSLFTKGIDETLFIFFFQIKEREGESEMFFHKGLDTPPLSPSPPSFLRNLLKMFARCTFGWKVKIRNNKS